MNPMATLLIDTDTVHSALEAVAIELHNHFLHEEGEAYRIEDLQNALAHWLELSVESLVEEALFHTVEGDPSVAFNRYAFEQQMKRIKPMKAPREVAHARHSEVVAA